MDRSPIQITVSLDHRWVRWLGFAVAVSALSSPMWLMAGSVPSTERDGLRVLVAGQEARAADVNHNFDAIAGAVDDNDARISALEAALPEGLVAAFDLRSVPTAGVS